MAKSESGNHSGPSVDAMIRGLTDRPNVHTTFILSRKDGTIIRATGLAYEEGRTSGAPEQAYQWSQPQTSGTDADAPRREMNSTPLEADEAARPSQTAKPIEVLATAVFEFLNNASILGETLGSVLENGSRADGTYATAGYVQTTVDSRGGTVVDDDAEDTTSENEVQLLRLRIKHHEIIIFPDSNYICCVVQKAGRTGVSQNKR